MIIGTTGMKYKKYFVRILTKRFPGSYEQISLDVDRRYSQISMDTAFSKKSSNPLDKRLDMMAYFLATMQSLQENGVDFQMIEKICIEIATEYVIPRNRFEKWSGKILPRLIKTRLSSLFLKIMDKRISKKGHKDGFLAKVITDEQETYGLGYGIDILECGICKLFNKHKAGEFSPILCKVDKVTSSLAGLELIRKGTIANGTDKCDFRFKKKKI